MISKCPVHATGCLDSNNFCFATPGRDTFWKWNSCTGRPNAFQTFSEYIIYGHENHCQSSKTPGLYNHCSWSNRPADDITLRCNHLTNHVKWSVGAPQGIEIAPTKQFRDFRRLNPSPASICWKISRFWKNPPHGTGCLAPYNFFVSQRPAVVLWENGIQTPADTTIFKSFQNTSFMVTKAMVKVRKRMDRTTAFRRTIAHVDDITLRCNHSTKHVNDTWARRKALKSRQQANFVILESWTLHQRQYFGKFHGFQISGPCNRLLGLV